VVWLTAATSSIQLTTCTLRADGGQGQDAGGGSGGTIIVDGASISVTSSTATANGGDTAGTQSATACSDMPCGLPGGGGYVYVRSSDPAAGSITPLLSWGAAKGGNTFNYNNRPLPGLCGGAGLLVDCQGVGYELLVPMSTFYNLPPLGDKVSLLTHFVVREDAQILYGFATSTEREAFRELIKISGVGPRTALSVLSGMDVGDLAQAVTLQEAGRLIKVPGIGKKTAERLLLELKGKLGADLGAPLGAVGDAQSDILQALLALGYSDKEAAAALKALPKDVGVSDGIKLALKSLAK
jgi:Holliday junction DNA helicase RuvA